MTPESRMEVAEGNKPLGYSSASGLPWSLDSHARSRVLTPVRHWKASQIRRIARLETPPGGEIPNRTFWLTNFVCSRSKVQVKDLTRGASPGLLRIAAIKLSCLDREFSGTWRIIRSQQRILWGAKH